MTKTVVPLKEISISFHHCDAAPIPDKTTKDQRKKNCFHGKPYFSEPSILVNNLAHKQVKEKYYLIQQGKVLSYSTWGIQTMLYQWRNIIRDNVQFLIDCCSAE